MELILTLAPLQGVNERGLWEAGGPSACGPSQTPLSSCLDTSRALRRGLAAQCTHFTERQNEGQEGE